MPPLGIQTSTYYFALLFPLTAPASRCSSSPAEVCQDHHDQVGREPDIVVTQVLVDVNEYQYPRKQDAQQNISPLRDRIERIQVRVKEQKDQKNNAREKQREKQKIEIHCLKLISGKPFLEIGPQSVCSILIIVIYDRGTKLRPGKVHSQLSQQ